jgi:hypothetical protein
MPGYETHKYVGMAAGMGYSAFQAKEQTPLNLVAEMVGGSVAGSVGGRLPDIIEPGTSSWHRSVAHSGTAAAALTVAAKTMLLDFEKVCRTKGDEFHNRANQGKMVPSPLQPNVSISVPVDPLMQLLYLIGELLCHFLAGLANGLAAGYVSHLALDACVGSRSIPLFG